jgi:hypothetical protein
MIAAGIRAIIAATGAQLGTNTVQIVMGKRYKK